MSKLALVILSIAALFMLVACDESTTAGEHAIPQTLDRTAEGGISVNNDSASLSGRVTLMNEEIVPGEGRVVPALSWVAKIDAPVVDGMRVQASYVYYDSWRHYAYVGYNTEGPEFSGGVEVIDVSDPRHPVIRSQALFNNTDIQGLDIDYVWHNTLWMASAIETDFTGYETPAAIEQVCLVNGLFPDPYSSCIYDLPSSVAKGVRKSGYWLYTASSRSDGGTYCHSLNSWNYMQIVEEDRYDNPKGICIDGNNIHSDHLILEAGDVTSNLHIYDVGTHDSNHEPLITDIGPATPYYAKMMCDIADNIAWVAMGRGGFKAFSIGPGASTHSPEPLFYFPVPDADMAAVDRGLCNAVTVDNRFIYVAQGEFGIYVFERPDKNSGFNPATWPSTQLEPIANFDFNGSANFAKACGNLVFVATGDDGLNILYRN